MARFTMTALVSAVLTTAAFGADPALLSFVLPDAKLVAGAYVDRDARSPFGQFVISQINANGDALSRFVNETGIDPTRDLQEVIVSSNGTVFVGAAKGRFDVDVIVVKAQAAGAQLSTYNGVQLLTTARSQPEYSRSVALLDTTYAIAGNTSAVEAAIDRRFQPPSFDTALAAKVNAVSGSNDAWFAATQVLPPKVASQAENATGMDKVIFSVLQSIQMLSGGVVFGSNIQGSAEAITTTGKDAQSLAMLIQLAVTMAQMRQGSPQIAQAAALLSGLQVAVTGSTVTASLIIPEGQIEQIIQAAAKPAARRGSPARLHR